MIFHSYMNIADAILNVLKADGHAYFFNREKKQIEFFSFHNSEIKVLLCTITLQDDGYIVSAHFPFGADINDSDRIAEMVAFVLQTNSRLRRGYLDFDMRTGGLLFKTSVKCKGLSANIREPLMREKIRDAIYFPGMLFADIGDGIVDIIFGNATAKEALQEIEKESLS